MWPPCVMTDEEGIPWVLEPGINEFKRLRTRSDLSLGEAFAIPAAEQ